jgi:hypothetical protein
MNTDNAQVILDTIDTNSFNTPQKCTWGAVKPGETRVGKVAPYGDGTRNYNRICDSKSARWSPVNVRG